MNTRRTILTLAASTSLAMTACSAPGGGGTTHPSFSQYVTIVLNTPKTKLPYVADITSQGAQLAADQVNAAGGIKVGGTTYGIRLEQMDNQLSPSTSLANVQKAVAEKAVAIIDDGYTSDATYKTAGNAGIPLMIDYDGNAALIDAAARPNVYRIAPPDDAIAAKLTDYLAGKNLKLAIASDDSEYGKDGRAQFKTALAGKSITPVADIVLPATSTDYSAQALQLKQSGATGVILWARAPVMAAMISAIRQGGSTAALYGGPNTEDPVVRTQNAAHPEWVEGVTYASFRITTESGPDAWDKFRKAYEDHNFNNGQPDYHVGVTGSEKKPIVQPPDWQIFPYDMIYLVKKALETAGTVDPTSGSIIQALNTVQVKSANGDNRGWTKDNHEGVVDDDIYFATFIDMKFKPVQDDPLSKSLTPIDQV